MKIFLLALFSLFLTVPAVASTNYFVAFNGNDSNNGTSSSTPWLTIQHAVNCGDTITALSGSYTGTTTIDAGARLVLDGRNPYTADDAFWTAVLRNPQGGATALRRASGCSRGTASRNGSS